MSLQVRNLQILPTIPFDDYLSLPGYSHSDIRALDRETAYAPTKQMQLGTKVHNYLLEPGKYDHSDIELVKPLALALKNDLGPLYKYLEPEVAILADFEIDGLRMPYKGRIDLLKRARIIIDLKVGEMPLKRAVEFFRYDQQLSGYAIAAGAEVAIIKQIHPKTKVISTYHVRPNAEFWEYQVKRLGEVIL